MAARKLPFKPTGIWTIKTRAEENSSKYIVLSSVSKTIVLSISNTIQTVTDSGLDLNKQTIHTNILEDNCIIQVTSDAFRQIRDRRVTQLKTDSKDTKFIKACSNSKQIVIAL